MSTWDDTISGARLRLRRKAPMFSMLALHATMIPDEHIETACTNGQDIRINPDFWTGLTHDERDFLLAHEVLHLALLHVSRRRMRDAILWNLAADIVVNGMCEAAGLKPIVGSVRDRKLETLRVEEVYELLQKASASRRRKFGAVPGQGLSDLGKEECGVGTPEQSRWNGVMRKAAQMQQSMHQGHGALGAFRDFSELLAPTLDWRTLLWRFLVRSPMDFCGFDRRFVGRGLYLEELAGEALFVHVCIDTSGSIDRTQLQEFLSEVSGILTTWPHVVANLWYADAQVHGPYPLKDQESFPTPVGGGGTDFRPFFQAVERDQDPFAPTVCVYLTDGHGTFPEQMPDQDTLWVATPGGLDDHAFPFGTVARLLKAA